MIYILIPLILIVTYRIRVNKKILLLLLCFFLTTTYYNGSDWRPYENIYNNPDLYNFKYKSSMEFLFIPTFKVFKTFIPTFILVMIMLKSFSFYIVNSLIEKSLVNMSLFYSIYIIRFGYFMYIDNPLRQMIAYTFFIVAIKAKQEKKLKKYIILIIIGSMYHFSLVLLLPYYFLNLEKLKTKKIIIIITVLIFICSNRTILKELISITQIIPIFYNRIYSYTLSSKYGYVSNYNISYLINVFEKIIMLIFFLKTKEKICKKYKYGGIAFTGSMMYILLYFLARNFKILDRYQSYYVIFYVLFIVYSYKELKGVVKMIYIGVVLIYNFIYCYQIINKNIFYKPYTNYIIHKIQFKEDLPYKFRSEYHLKKGAENGNLIKK